MNDNPTEVVALALASAKFAATERYLARGRLLEGLSDDRLTTLYVQSYCLWAQDINCPTTRQLSCDTAAELALRHVEPPHEELSETVETLRRAAIARIDSLSDDEAQEFHDYLAEEWVKAHKATN